MGLYFVPFYLIGLMDKKRGPKTTPELRAAWSLAIELISARAKLPIWRLEALFGVGDATGRVWRTWRNAVRVARKETRRRILQHAFAMGWLIPNMKQLRELQYLDDPIIQRFVNTYCGAPPVPLVLLRLSGWNPWIAADWLLGLAMDKQARTRRERLPLDRVDSISSAGIDPAIVEQFRLDAQDLTNSIREIKKWLDRLKETMPKATEEQCSNALETALTVAYQDLLRFDPIARAASSSAGKQATQNTVNRAT